MIKKQFAKFSIALVGGVVEGRHAIGIRVVHLGLALQQQVPDGGDIFALRHELDQCWGRRGGSFRHACGSAHKFYWHPKQLVGGDQLTGGAALAAHQALGSSRTLGASTLSTVAASQGRRRGSVQQVLAPTGTHYYFFFFFIS